MLFVQENYSFFFAERITKRYFILDLPNASWNSPETFQCLHDILGKLRLSPAPSPAEDGKQKID